jgi:hypothetical protein
LILEMPRPRPPYLHRQVTRHGKTVWYVRRQGCNRIRIHGVYDTPEFKEQYQAAMRGESFTETGAWLNLAGSTRRARENLMRPVLEASGKEQSHRITTVDIERGRNRRIATPSQSRCFLDLMRGLFGWAASALPDHVPANPTAGVKNPKEGDGVGFPPWREEEVLQYEAYWPLGTRERGWLAVIRYSGLRRGDAVVAGKQHVRMVKEPETGRFIRAIQLVTEKSRNKAKPIMVTLPILPVGRPCLHLRREWETAQKDILRQCFQRGGARSRNPGQIGSWTPQDCSDQGGELRRHSLAAQGPVRVGER